MKKEKGITLIALVITIIILLILAGITINIVLGENGIIKHTITAKEEYEKKAIQEKVDLILADLIAEEQISGKKITKEELEKKLKDNQIEAEVDDTQIPWKIKLADGTIITVDQNVESEGSSKIVISQEVKEWLDKMNVTLTPEDILASEKLLEENGLTIEEIKGNISEDKAAELIQKTEEKEFTMEMAVTSKELMEKILNTQENLDNIIQNEEIFKEIISSPVVDQIIEDNQEIKQKIENAIPKIQTNEIICSSELWNATGAFDNNFQTAWCNNDNQIPSYVGCKLANKTRLYQFEVYTGIQEGYLVKKFIIQGSNDGINWKDLTEELTSKTSNISSLAYKGKPTKNQNEDYLYFRVYCTQGGNASETQISEIHFYGV